MFSATTVGAGLGDGASRLLAWGLGSWGVEEIGVQPGAPQLIGGGVFHPPWEKKKELPAYLGSVLSVQGLQKTQGTGRLAFTSKAQGAQSMAANSGAGFTYNRAEEEMIALLLAEE